MVIDDTARERCYRVSNLNIFISTRRLLRSFEHRVYGALKDPRTSKFEVIMVPKRGKQSSILVRANGRKVNDERLNNDTSCGKWIEQCQIAKTLSREKMRQKKI